MAAIDERRTRRAAIENSTQLCSSTGAPHLKTQEKDFQFK